MIFFCRPLRRGEVRSCSSQNKLEKDTGITTVVVLLNFASVIEMELSLL